MVRAPLGPAQVYLRMLAAIGEDLATTTNRDERDSATARSGVHLAHAATRSESPPTCTSALASGTSPTSPADGPLLVVRNHGSGFAALPVLR
jgi:hypothetical protein